MKTSNRARTKSSAAKAMPKRRILIVDDHPLVRHGLAELINNEPDLEVCGMASDAREGLTMTRELRPDLATVDISMKGANGIDLLKQVKSELPDVAILVVSMHDDALFAERALQAGAMGYINKEEAMDRIIDAIRRVLDGKVYLCPEMTDRLLARQREGRGEQPAPEISVLSDRELEVFDLIGRGLKTGQIATKLKRSPKTIETHREHIKRKLGLSTNMELVRRAVQWTLDNQ